MLSMPLIEQQVRMQYRLLNHTGFYTRVRASHEKEEKYLCGIEEILEWARPRASLGNLYISRNPFTEKREVAGISGFTVDVDKIREPKDRATTTDELRGTLAVASKINASFGNCGIVATSGNGALLLFPFNALATGNLDEFVRKAQILEKQLQNHFGTDEVRIDATNYAKAILRLMGSPNIKDNDSRKWRYARFIRTPVFRAKRSRILDAIKGVVLPEPAVEDLAQLHGVANQAAGVGISLSSVAHSDQATGLRPSARLELAEGSLRRLNPARCDNYDDWLKCGIALKEFGPVGLELWKQWSRQSSKYREGDCESKFRTFRGDQRITIGTIKYWADQDSGPRQVLSGLPVLGQIESGTARPKLWVPADGQVRRDDGRDSGQALSTGFKWLDEHLNGGYRGGYVYALHGVTNAGKSTFIVQAARNVCETGKRVLFVATEASEQEVEERYVALGSGVSASKISARSMSESDSRKVAAYKEIFRAHKLGIYYTTSPNTGFVTQYIEEFKPDLIVWDYYQHFETKENMRYNQLGEYARWFETTAIKHNIPILVGSQLHLRKDFKTGKKKDADMTDVKDCPIINDAAKVVITLDWSPMEATNDTAPTMVRMTIDKNKGKQGTTKLLLRREIPSFEEI